MDKGEQAEKHRDRCRHYLDQTSDAYIVDPTTGLYRPKAQAAKTKPATSWTDKAQGVAALFGMPVSGIGLLVSILGLVLSIVTVLLLWETAKIYSRQLSEMQKANDATENAVKIAAGTLKETVRTDRQQQKNYQQQQEQSVKDSDASRKQSDKVLQATIDNFRLDQRAWIGFQSIEVERNRKVETHDKNTGRPIKQVDYKPIRLTIVNTGKTPAVIDRFEGNTYNWQQDQLLEGPDQNTKVASILGMYVEVPPAVMIPGQTVKAQVGGGIMTAPMELVPMEVTKVEVDYRDAWNNPHSTKLCIFVTYWQIKDFEYCPWPNSNSMN